MNSEKLNTRYAGLLIIAGMVAGILSVVPAVDSTDYLKEAATNSHCYYQIPFPNYCFLSRQI